MLRDKINQRLLGLLLFLMLLYGATSWLQNRSGSSKVLSTSLVHVDTSRISRIEISKNEEELILLKNENGWHILRDDQKEIAAVDERIHNMLGSLMYLLPSRIAANAPERWKDYQVDEAGTRIRLMEGANPRADLVIGRGGMEGQTSFYTYVRPYDQDNVYVIENFSGSSVTTEAHRFRDQNILSIIPDSIHQLTFDYPDEAGFTLFRSDSIWSIDGEQADSAAVADYLKDLRRIRGSSFVDDRQPSSGEAPVASLQIRGEEEVWLRLYGMAPDQVLHSSQNPKNYFSDSSAIHTLFFTRDNFLSPGMDDQ